MQEYKVEWRIDINAESPEEAAFKALMINRDSDSIAVVYEVTDKFGVTTFVDLDHSDTLRKLILKLLLDVSNSV